MQDVSTAPSSTAATVAAAALDGPGRTLHATVALADTAAAEAAHRDALREGGVSLGPLHGVPFAVKDIIDVAGMPTAAGSATRPDQPAAATDATVVARLRAAGAVVTAKVHTVEHAFGGWGTNASQGTPVNPWRRDVPYTPGGSSSGTGVAVGARLVPAGLGTDTGGSVRIPAAFCGCVGHKSSIGLVSRAGVVPLSGTFDTVGPLTDTVRRAAEMLAAMQGEDAADASTHGIARADPCAGLDRGIAGLTLVHPPHETLLRCDPQILTAFEAACDLLSAAGAVLLPRVLPHDVLEYQRRATTIIASDAYSLYAEMADDPATLLNATTRMRILMGRDVSAYERLRAERARAVDIAEFAAWMDRADAMVLPTTPLLPVPHAVADENVYDMSLYTRMNNYLGLCGLSVPMGLSVEGLPMGLQIVGRHLDDPLVLRIGAAFEAARGPFAAPPAV
ncbi:MAG: amidase [Pseudomonadota bacterium]